MEPEIIEKEAKKWGMSCHISALLSYLGIPFGGIIGPLVVWLAKRNEGAFVDEQGKEALNFNITFSIFFSVMVFFYFIGMVCILLFESILQENQIKLLWIFFASLTLLTMLASIIAHITLTIIASIKASHGQFYRYPCSVQFIK
jgi:uncharacterized Tic20 family protein